MIVSDFEYMALRRILPALSDAMSDTLFDIDGEKSDIITDDIRRYTFGASAVEGEYPALSLMGLRDNAQTDEEDWRISQFTYDIEIYAVHDDPSILEKQCARYARAVKRILWNLYPSTGSVQSIEYPPALSRGSMLYKGVAIVYRLLVRENKTD